MVKYNKVYGFLLKNFKGLAKNLLIRCTHFHVCDNRVHNKIEGLGSFIVFSPLGGGRGPCKGQIPPCTVHTRERRVTGKQRGGYTVR